MWLLKNNLWVLLLMTGAGSASQTNSTPVKIGVVHLQKALLGTRDGQVAAKELQAKATSKEQPLVALQKEITQLRDQLNKSASVSSREQQEALTGEIERKTRVFNRQVDDVRADLDQEQSRVLNELGNRMVAVINRYALSNGYALIIDISAPQSQVLHASDNLDVTSAVIKLFDADGAEQAPPKQGATK